MAQLPRYQRLGVKARQPGTIDFADTREQARYSQTLASALDRMSQFAFKEASVAAQSRGQERVREEGAVETLERIDAKGGAFSIADQAAYELGSRVAVAEIQNAAEIETMRILSEGERNETAFSKIQAQLLEVTDGYSESLRVIDPVSASLLQENLSGVTGKAVERYSNYYVNLQASKQKAKANDAAALQSQNIISGAVIPGSSEVTIRQDITRAGELLRGLGASDSEVNKWEQNTYKAAIKENFIFNFQTSDIDRQTEILKEMETVPAAELSLSQTLALRGSLKAGLNEKLSARRSASTIIVSEISEMTFVVENGGMPSQSQISVLEAQADDLGPDGVNARVALSTLKYNMGWAGAFRKMTLDQIEDQIIEIKKGLPGFAGSGLDTPQEIYTLKTAETYKAAAEIALKNSRTDEKTAFQPKVNEITNRVTELQKTVDAGFEVKQESIDELVALYEEIPPRLRKDLENALADLSYTGPLLSKLKAGDPQSVKAWIEKLEETGISNVEGPGIDTNLELKALATAEIALKDQTQEQIDLFQPKIKEIATRISDLQDTVNSGIEVDQETINEVIALYKEIPPSLREDLETSLEELAYIGPLLKRLNAGDPESVSAWLVKLRETGIRGFEGPGIDTRIELTALTIGENVLSAMEKVKSDLTAAEKEKFDPIIVGVKSQIATLQSIVDKGIEVSDEAIQKLVETFATIPENLRGNIDEDLNILGFTDEMVTLSTEGNVEGMRAYLSRLESSTGGIEGVGEIGPDSPIEDKAIALARQLVSSMAKVQSDTKARNEKIKSEKYDPIVEDLNKKISAFETIVKSGREISQNDFIELFSIFSDLPDDFRGDILESIEGVGYLSDVVQRAQTMNVDELTRYIEVLGQGFSNERPGGLETLTSFPGNVNTQIEQERLNLAEQMRDKMISGLKNDPLTYGIKAGILGQNGLPLELNPIDITSGFEAAVSSLKERISVAKTIAGKYIIKPKFFTQNEKSNIEEFLRSTDGETKMGVLSALVQAGGPDAPDMLSEISKNSPFDAGVGALVLMDRSATARMAYRGQASLDSGQVPNGWSKQIADEAFSKFNGRSLDELTQTVGIILPIAKAIYTNIAAEEEFFDEELWQEAISLSLGGIPKAGLGGIQDVRGRQTLLPPNITSEQVEDALNGADDLAFAYASSQKLRPGMVVDISGTGMRRDKRFGVQRASEDGMYYIISDKATHIVEGGGTFKKFKFDLNKLINYVEGTR